MLAAVFKGDGVLALEQRPAPQIQDAHDVLLAIKGVGICGTDLHILEMPPRHPASRNMIMGHEFCGQVVEVGPAVTNCKPGDRVAVDQNAGCGHCEECRRGFPNACLTVFSAPVPGFANTPGIFRDGALARYAVMPDYMVYPVTDPIPWHHLAITETVACAVNAVQKAGPQMGETAVVLGAGPVGLLLIALLKGSGCRVIATEVVPRRAEMAKQVGAEIVIDPRKEDAHAVVEAVTGGRGVDIAIEAVGPLMEECLTLARFGGRVVLFGHDETARPQIAPAIIVRKELRVYGVFLTKNTFVPAIQLLKRGLLPMDRVISHVLPLSRITEGHQLIRQGEALKVVIDPSIAE
jgi:threonine dehydrogenase-like Zn-dependent dehydrogenase